jgi:GT2 family glycosyltransferase
VNVSVVICTYTAERWDDLVAALDSVRAQTLPPAETIVVVDHDDALLARAREDLGDVVVVANAGARGLSAARNMGVAIARSDVVAFLDDDAVAEPEWLEHLVEPYADRDVVAVGGKIEPIWNLRGEARPQRFPPELDWVVGCTYRGMPERAAAVRNVIGANMSFRRSAVVELGGFRTDVGRVGAVPFGCEETDLCIRAQRRDPNARILYQPRARVHHHVPEARTTWRYLRGRCFAEGRSKAVLCRRVGAEAGLASERRYATQTLSRAILRDLGNACTGELGAATRIVSILVSVAAATAGYVVGRVAFADARQL